MEFDTNNITLSSGEAELATAVKMSMEDWGIKREARVYVDSSAAIGEVFRRGNDKLRHVNIGLLWIQERVET